MYTPAQNRLFIGVFVGCLFLPLVGLVFHLGNAPSTQENRALAPTPSWDDLRHSSEAYFNDHFGFRQYLINSYHFIQRKLGKSASEKVLMGQDHWLFYAHDGALQDHKHEDPFSAEQLHAWQTALSQKQAWLQQKNIAYQYVIAPNKGTIYPEYLPEDLSVLDQVKRVDQLSQQMASTPNFTLLDLRSVIQAAKTHAQVYYKTDSHWNYVGANAAQHAIIQQLSPQFPKLQGRLLDANQFQHRVAPGGDLAQLLGLGDALNDTLFTPSVPLVCADQVPLGDSPLLQTMGKGVIHQTHCAQGHYNALIIHDSFGFALKPYLAQYFTNAVFVWARPNLSTLQAWVELYQPDIVIEQRVERKLRSSPWGKQKK